MSTIIKYPDGSSYEGEFKDDMFDGFGILIYSDGEKYEGFFEKDKFNGLGKYEWKDGSIYEGKWKNGLRNFLGKMIYWTGHRYEGNWEDEQRKGFGKMVYKEGQIYEGNWENDEVNGFGKYIYKEGQIYEGNWENGKINGFGKYIWENGEIYEGNYENGVKNGFGKYIWKNGKIYEGNWVNGVKNGFGKIVYTDGEVFVGEFIKGIKQIKSNIEVSIKPIKYYLFFDTETTGLPRNWKAPISDFNNWPRLVQLAYILYDENGNKIEENDYIIKPDNFTIPKEASNIHGITTEIAIEEGYSIDYVLGVFQKLIQKSEYLVAHNISFDEKIMGCEFLRNDFENKINDKKRICTMEKTTNFCKLDGPYGYKWPKLSELHKILFGYIFDEAHDASVDIKATAKCFWELRKRNIL